MMKDKAFDCVAMKDAVQAELRREFAGLTDEEMRQRIADDLEASDPIAGRWRALCERETLSAK